jgi:hypothetical protein
MKRNEEPIKKLEGIDLRGYLLHVGEEKQLSLSGWKGIKLYLMDPGGDMTDQPVIEGIFSRGRRGKIQPWMDLSYREAVRFKASRGGKDVGIRLNEVAIDSELFLHLGALIPPGGHLMVSYEGSDDIHRDTLRGLYAGIPPAATPLGFLIFNSGFQYIKDWYLAEGGHEGPRKLWGEKSPDREWENIYFKKTEEAVEKFLKGPIETEQQKLNEAGIKRAEAILRVIRASR